MVRRTLTWSTSAGVWFALHLEMEDTLIHLHLNFEFSIERLKAKHAYRSRLKSQAGLRLRLVLSVGSPLYSSQFPIHHLDLEMVRS